MSTVESKLVTLYTFFNSFICEYGRLAYYLKAGVDLHFLPPGKNRRGLISITGSVTDKNCSKQSQPEMSIT